MLRTTPTVSIGMPVYNGEKYLGEAIESLLGQTFGDLEIILSDNASSDGTQELCEKYRGLDQRVRYFRNPTNIGAGGNHRQVFRMARGKYFKWQSRDDLCAPSFLEKCIQVLESDPGVVLCHSLTSLIDEHGQAAGPYLRRLDTNNPRPEERFRQIVWYDHMCFQIYGLIRSDAIRRAGNMPSCVHGDGILLANLALQGRFYEIPEYLFFNRAHPARSAAAIPERLQRPRRSLARSVGPQPPPEWWSPHYKGRIVFPYLRITREYVAAIMDAPLNPWQRCKILASLIPWLGKVTPRVATDLVIALDQLVDPILNAGR
jgi:glycosyltransferase involved in cell wall biosynthesis